MTARILSGEQSASTQRYGETVTHGKPTHLGPRFQLREMPAINCCMRNLYVHAQSYTNG